MAKITLEWSKLLMFSADGVLNNIPNSQGVYRLSQKSQDGKFYVFYVSETDNLKSKLSEHLDGQGENQCLKERLTQKSILAFRYAVVTDEKVRSDAKRYMYKYYAPECNAQEPVGLNGLEINLN